MKSIFYRTSYVLFTISIFCIAGFSQDQPTSLPVEEEQVQAPSYETFEMQEGDTTYIMKKYFLCIYKSGPERDQEKEALNNLSLIHI